MIALFSTGSEAEHEVAICIRHIAYLKPHGRMCWIYLTNGEKFLVDGNFDKTTDAVRHAYWEMLKDQGG